MRLIDADALLQAIEDNSPMNWTDSESEIQADIDYKCFADMVKNQPTAYDVDAVVEQFKNLAECNDECAKTFYEGMGCKACMWSTMMNIIRKGGVNE